ncbi:double-stranded RNA-binding protein 4-like isoform X1 [Aristolochia californica]|uniref:double-stranded RNA-binding protein 4-like isoform X1 n=1 Tax=Aristolochia californica TaxID=171875 RepID=UPI0035E06F17
MEPPALPTPSKPSVPEQLMHKNRLQEYAQRSALPLPVYQTVNEGLPHDPKFRSTVIVDGATYKSSQRFRNRKAAEQDVAKLALDSIMKKIKDEGLPQISQDTVFCKSILNEFAVKMNLPKPSYSTPQSGDLLPIFTSSLVFDGKTYVGNPGKNKKEAEQKAARTVIQSILGTSSSRTVLTEIIKSKSRLFAAIHKGNGWSSSCGSGVYGSPAANKSLASHSNVLPSAHLSVVSVTSELKKPKEELVYDSLVGLAGNEKVSLKYLSSGPSQRIRDPETGISGIHSDHNSVLNEGNAMTACTSPLSVDCTRLSKRQRKRNNQELAKRLKTEQQ